MNRVVSVISLASCSVLTAVWLQRGEGGGVGGRGAETGGEGGIGGWVWIARWRPGAGVCGFVCVLVGA
jgi:hypothetical protein